MKKNKYTSYCLLVACLLLSLVTQSCSSNSGKKQETPANDTIPGLQQEQESSQSTSNGLSLMDMFEFYKDIEDNIHGGAYPGSINIGSLAIPMVNKDTHSYEEEPDNETVINEFATYGLNVQFDHNVYEEGNLWCKPIFEPTADQYILVQIGDYGFDATFFVSADIYTMAMKERSDAGFNEADEYDEYWNGEYCLSFRNIGNLNVIHIFHRIQYE